jgi:hypothetical protein
MAALRLADPQYLRLRDQPDDCGVDRSCRPQFKLGLSRLSHYVCDLGSRTAEGLGIFRTRRDDSCNLPPAPRRKTAPPKAFGVPRRHRESPD